MAIISDLPAHSLHVNTPGLFGSGSTPCGFSKHGCVKADHSHHSPDGSDRSDRPYHFDNLLPATGAAAAAVNSGGLPDCAHCVGTHCQTTGCSFPMYVSDGLDGPWRTFRPLMNIKKTLNPLNFTGQFSISGPWIAANGTTTTILQTGDFNDVYPEELRLNNVRE
jgi:hypothetical protein